MYKIAITSRQKEETQVFLLKNNYYYLLKDEFQIELVLPRQNNDYQDIVDRNDALLICGGDDVHPYYYHQTKHQQTFLENPFIEKMDFCLLSQFYKAHKTIIGICRGIQVINVFFHGTLYQDISKQYPTLIQHSKEYHLVKTYHSLTKYYPTEMKVNSYHHQNIKDIAPLFHINAISEDNLIEGIENHYVLAMQWHPELMNEEHQKSFIQLIKDKIEKNITHR